MLYDYQCERGHRHELPRRVAERDDPATCPQCEEPCVRQVGGGHFALKGDGWAASNYGLKPEPK